VGLGTDVSGGVPKPPPAVVLQRSPTLVTGASGFIGSQVCVAFSAKGYPVRAFVTDRSRAPASAGSAVPGDLLDRDAVREAVRGVGTVVHLAARVHVLNDRSADREALYQRTNVEGTRVLLEEAARAGVERFVFISSVKAVGESSVNAWTEETPPAPQDPYGRSKLDAERVVREIGEREGMHVPILRLPLVYGPGMKGNMLRLFEAVARGWPLPFGAVPNRRSLVYSGNLVAAIEAVAIAPVACATFFVTDGRDLSTTELIQEIARALGRPARLIPVPVAVFRAAGRLGDRLARVVPSPLTSVTLDRLLGSLVVDSSKLRRVTGFIPPFTVERGLRETAAWFKRQR
jgi:nucleoside-diphosphate-sugar epimerase